MLLLNTIISCGLYPIYHRSDFPASPRRGYGGRSGGVGMRSWGGKEVWKSGSLEGLIYSVLAGFSCETGYYFVGTT